MLEIIAGSAMAIWALASFAAPIVAVCLVGPAGRGAVERQGAERVEQADV